MHFIHMIVKETRGGTPVIELSLAGDFQAQS
jgi:hypothetical protein